MALIKGTKITLLNRVQNGVDDFGCPVFSSQEEIIENVLIEPVSSEDILSETDLLTKHIRYTLHIPKEDNHNWVNRKVKFYGQTFKTVGMPIEYIKENTPLDWNKKVQVEAYE